jgi:capsular exopolysaccharide synthesis family protein
MIALFIRRKWLFVPALMTGVLITLLVIAGSTSLYEGEVRILVEGEKFNLDRPGETAAIDNYSVFENYLKTQIELIKSRAISGRVADEFGLHEEPRYTRRSPDNLWRMRSFEDDIVLRRLSGSRMIALVVYHPDPQQAARIANRLAQVYVEDNSERRASGYVRDQRIAELSSELEVLSSEYARMAGIADDDSKASALRLKIDRITREILQVRSHPGVRAQRTNGSVDQSSVPDAGPMTIADQIDTAHRELIGTSAKVSNVSIVDEAIAAPKPAKPDRLVILCMGVLLTALLSYGLIIVVDRLDDRIRTEQDLQEVLGRSPMVLGSLPRSKRGGAGLGRLNGGTAAAQPKTPADEFEDQLYSILCTRVLWSLPQDQAGRSIVICGSQPGEGKTTVSLNLALTIASLQKKVLLVDADFRRGRQHEIHGISGETGLANYLEGSSELDQIIAPSRVRGLDLVPVGRINLNSSWLFHSQRMDRFLEEVKAKYDFVLFDAPPITVVADASILVQKAGIAIFVVRSGQTTAASLRHAHQILDASKASVLGYVLNDSSSHDQLGYSKYSKYYAATAR